MLKVMTSRQPFLCRLLVVLLCSGVTGMIIDLSHPLSHNTIYWPGQPKFNRTVVVMGSNKDKVWIEVGAFSSGEHGGTHIDAPRHFSPHSYDLKDLPLEHTIAEGVMIDARAEAALNNDYQLTVEKLKAWETDHGRIPDKAAVLVNFGWTSRWSNPREFFGTNDVTNHTTFHFPVVSAEAARWLLDHRHLKILAVDVPAPDGPTDTTFPVHRLLLSQNIVIIENVMVPDSLPARGFRLHAAPIRVEGGTGVQTRVYAMLYDDVTSRSPLVQHLSILLCLLVGTLACWLAQV
ncbi:isatin hydrolase-like [Physella acuta]|uniref:isatin hydrolase-like n=1 Tax=Physella acuta TaxID=109671 RepID=UPI0027DAE942|nr:isatin hydrolase-like [Physella acuta]XP_059143102.1 isatin hydrolase-like [Physella acuta]